MSPVIKYYFIVLFFTALGGYLGHKKRRHLGSLKDERAEYIELLSAKRTLQILQVLTTVFAFYAAIKTLPLQTFSMLASLYIISLLVPIVLEIHYGKVM